jgi:hypothetical protein
VFSELAVQHLPAIPGTPHTVALALPLGMGYVLALFWNAFPLMSVERFTEPEAFAFSRNCQTLGATPAELGVHLMEMGDD